MLDKSSNFCFSLIYFLHYIGAYSKEPIINVIIIDKSTIWNPHTELYIGSFELFIELFKVVQIRISNCLKQRNSTCSYSLYISRTRVTIQFVGQGQVTDNDQARGQRTASKMAAFQMTNYTPWKEHKGGRAGRRTKL